MPMDKSRYPANWDEISKRIRHERAGDKCEWCGVPNGATILRSKSDPKDYLVYKDDCHYTPDGTPVRLSEMNADAFWDQRYIKIVLTVHHIGVDKPDGTPGDRHDKMDCRDENLAALCQSCHWKADWDIHFAKAQAARRAKHEKSQPRLF